MVKQSTTYLEIKGLNPSAPLHLEEKAGENDNVKKSFFLKSLKFYWKHTSLLHLSANSLLLIGIQSVSCLVGIQENTHLCFDEVASWPIGVAP